MTPEIMATAPGGRRCRRRLVRLCGYFFLLLAGAPAGHGECADACGAPKAAPAGDALLCDMVEEELDRRLQQAAVTHPDFNERLEVLARGYVGCAGYYADPLSREEDNWFPYQKTNCTLYVLYVAAMANSASIAQARCHMRRLHYRGGVVGFKNRYHFTSDRITDPDNRYFSECTARSVRDPSRLKSVTINLNRGDAGTFFFGGPLNGWSRQVRMTYIPREGFEPGMLKPLPRVTGIAFVKKENWPRGVFIGHEGLLIDGDLYHSSVKAGVTIVSDYLNAAFARSAWEGIVFFTANQVSLEEPCPEAGVPELQAPLRALRER